MFSGLVCTVFLVGSFSATAAFIGPSIHSQPKVGVCDGRLVTGSVQKHLERRIGSALLTYAKNEMNGNLPKQAKTEKKGKLPKPKILHDSDGMPHVSFSDIPGMDKIDQVERDMKHNQEVAADMIKELQKDLAVQRMLRHESQSAMDRLHLVRNDMERKMHEMENRHEEETERIIMLKARELAEKDRIISEKTKIIEEYEGKQNDLKYLSRRFAQVVGSRVKKPLSHLLRRKNAVK